MTSSLFAVYATICLASTSSPFKHECVDFVLKPAFHTKAVCNRYKAPLVHGWLSRPDVPFATQQLKETRCDTWDPRAPVANSGTFDETHLDSGDGNSKLFFDWHYFWERDL